MTLHVEPSERFMDAVHQWADARMMDEDEALAVKAEQAFLEIGHLVSGTHDVAFDVEDGELVLEPDDELVAFLDRQAEQAGIDPETVLALHVNLFANAFLEQGEQEGRPPDAAPSP